MPHLSDHLSLVSPCGSVLVNSGTQQGWWLGKTPRSYEVTLTDGRKFRGNRHQLRPSAPAHTDRYENNDDLEFETRLTHLLPLTTTKRTKTGLGPTLMIMRRLQFSQTLDKEQRWKHSSHTQLEQDVLCVLRDGWIIMFIKPHPIYILIHYQ